MKDLKIILNGHVFFGFSCPRDYLYAGTSFAIPSIVLIGGSTWIINKQKNEKDLTDDDD